MIGKVKGLVIAGVSSSAGKTTVGLALMAAFRRRGLKVQAFKVGPDFIDPGHHAVVTGRPSHNLDGWMLPASENRAIFARYAAGADLALVEGVMGLYDGFEARGEAGSTAQMAKLLGLPVLLVAEASSMARSFAALVGGYRDFDPDLAWAGVVANRVGGENHRDILGRAMELVPGLEFRGGLARRPELALAERHLGLITAEEGGLNPEAVNRLVDWVEEGLDLDSLLADLPELNPVPPEPEPAAEFSRPVRLAVARDKAFCFYYRENLRHLEAAGAELAFFSPLVDESLPVGAQGLYLGGGYPELFAARLAANKGLLGQIARLGRNGLPIYAECGGMMYLGRELRDLAGKRHSLVGLLPLSFNMLERLRSLGYREVRLTRDTLLGPAGTVARGHEFHYSEIDPDSSGRSLDNGVYQVGGRGGPLPDTHGFQVHNTLASYVHLHLGSNPALAPNLVEAIRNWNRE